MTQRHDFLQEQIVLSLCVHLSCFAQQVALFHREHAKDGCFQTVYLVSPICLKNQVLRANLFHRSRGNGTFHLQQPTHLLCYQVSPINHRLLWALVGLVGRTLHVELLTRLLNKFTDRLFNSSFPLVQS